MPVVDGWVSTRMIREYEEANPLPSRAAQASGRTPIFAVSGIVRRSDETRCRETGFDGWLPKPVNMSRLASWYVAVPPSPRLFKTSIFRSEHRGASVLSLPFPRQLDSL